MRAAIPQIAKADGDAPVRAYGRQVGSFTVCALFRKMPKEQADYYRRNHGFDC